MYKDCLNMFRHRPGPTQYMQMASAASYVCVNTALGKKDDHRKCCCTAIVNQSSQTEPSEAALETP